MSNSITTNAVKKESQINTSNRGKSRFPFCFNLTLAFQLIFSISFALTCIKVKVNFYGTYFHEQNLADFAM